MVGTPKTEGGLARYEELETRADTGHAFGLAIKIASLDDIIDAKLALRREQDLVVLPELYRLRDLGRE